MLCGRILVRRNAAVISRGICSNANVHRISIRVRRLESANNKSRAESLFSSSFRPLSQQQRRGMASTTDRISEALAALSITPQATVSHDAVTSPAQWKEALAAHAEAPKSFELIKTLVYKPKTAKSATPVPVVVIAREETEANSGAIGKQLNLKELRLANEDLLKEFFGLDKDSCTLLYFSLSNWFD